MVLHYYFDILHNFCYTCYFKVSRLAINMEGGFQTNKEAEYDEEVAIVLLPSMQKIEVQVVHCNFATM